MLTLITLDTVSTLLLGQFLSGYFVFISFQAVSFTEKISLRKHYSIPGALLILVIYSCVSLSIPFIIYICLSKAAMILFD